jgi:hypothetical protein
MKFKHLVKFKDHYEVKVFCNSHFGPDCFPNNDGRWSWDLERDGSALYHFDQERDYAFFLLRCA